MDKSTVNQIIGIVVLIIVIAGILSFVEYNKSKNSVEFLREGLTLIKQGEYDDGLNNCDRMMYYNSICYETAFELKLAKNESITEYFCERIPLDDKVPFWEFRRSEHRAKAVEIKDKCMEQIQEKQLNSS